MYTINTRNDKCKLCNKAKGKHKADTLNCPIGRGRFPTFKVNEFFTPKRKYTKKDDNTFIL